MQAQHILADYVHFPDGSAAQAVHAGPSFWHDLANGLHPALAEGRLLTAFSFSAPWPTWERHPAGEELVMLLAGAASVVLELDGGEHVVELREPGAYVLVPRGTWHTARTNVATTVLFLTPGAGTETRPAQG